MAKKKFDWLEMEKEYITSQDITYRELAEIYGISENHLRRIAAREKWSEKREKHLEKILKKTCDKLADSTVKKLVKSTENLIESLEKASKELHIHEEFNMFGKLVKKETETVRVGKLSSLIKSLTLLQKIELEKEKLKLEKEKLNNSNDAENKLEEILDVLKEGISNE